MKNNKLRKLYNYFNKKPNNNNNVEFEPYKIKINTSALTVRKGPEELYDVVGIVKEGDTFVIVEECYDRSGELWGLLKAFRKERNGWIKLKYTKKK